MKILVIDDEISQREILSDILIDAGYEVETAASGEEGLNIVYKGGIYLVLTDLKMPGKDGIQILKEILGFDQDIQVILMTAFGTIPSAVNAIKCGAYDYLTKPFQKQELLRVVKRAADKVRLVIENRDLRDQIVEKFSFHNLVGSSQSIKCVFKLIEKIKNVDATVIITGESGTGKELVAKAIHYGGRRKKGPFIVVNCGAIPENLIESELFGYEKGAFTGATRTYAGKFEQAQGGTIFLDEIGVMPLSLQVRLLRVLQEKKISKIGSNQSTDVDVRVVAATNENLQKKIQENQFRIDLYHRLNIFSIHLPALRDRKEDIPLLAKHFLEKYANRYGQKKLSLSPGALKKLEEYAFPGNVRELENILEKTVILTEQNIIEPQSLMFDDTLIVGQTSDDRSPTTLPQIEYDHIIKALKDSGGSIKEAARNLGLSYKTLQYRMKKHGLDKKDFKSTII